MDAGSIPSGLSERAVAFVKSHGVRVDVATIPGWWERQLGRGVPTEVLDWAAQFVGRWGGIVLPPSTMYEGGPDPFCLCELQRDGQNIPGWWIEAGVQRASVNFGFYLTPDGSFGVSGGAGHWVPLHASVQGWVEALALEYELTRTAVTVTRVAGVAVDGLDMSGMVQVTETQGLADTWWRGENRWVAIFRGESLLYDQAKYAVALVYTTQPERDS